MNITNVKKESVGKLVISFDFELGWGSIENGLWKIREKQGVFQNCRYIIPELISLLDDYEVPSVWATVGAMIEPPIERDFSHLPLSIRTEIEEALRKSKPETFDGIDLSDAVLLSQNTKLACHSYSHIRFNREGCTADTIRSEMVRFINAAASVDVHPFFVFPQNIEGYHDVLKEFDIKTIRRREYDSSSRLWSLYKRYISPSHYSQITKHESGLITKRGNVFFSSGSGMVKKAAWPFVYRNLIGRIDKIAANGGEFHLWTHPFNFAEHDLVFTDFKRFLSHVVALRDQGLLEIDYV